ncbi:hypothetical protein CCP2SC5_2370003 [Azospirillaceae bacterium]
MQGLKAELSNHQLSAARKESVLSASIAQREAELRVMQNDLATAQSEAAERQAQLQQSLEQERHRRKNLESELSRRGSAGTPAAVRMAFTDMFRDMHVRRMQRMAIEEPWRLPPDYVPPKN